MKKGESLEHPRDRHCGGAWFKNVKERNNDTKGSSECGHRMRLSMGLSIMLKSAESRSGSGVDSLGTI